MSNCESSPNRVENETYLKPPATRLSIGSPVKPTKFPGHLHLGIGSPKFFLQFQVEPAHCPRVQIFLPPKKHIHAACSASESQNPYFHQLKTKIFKLNLSVESWNFEVIDQSSCLATSNSWRDPFTPINAWQASRGTYRDLSIEVENPLVSSMMGMFHAETRAVPQTSPYR